MNIDDDELKALIESREMSLLEIIERHKKLVEDLEEILEGLKDERVPVDVRWSCYRRLVQKTVITDIESDGNGFVDLLDSTGESEILLYNDFWVERHQTVYYTDMYERILDLVEEGKITAESVDVWRAAVLKYPRYAGFVFDW